jgi:hypothetical protein
MSIEARILFIESELQWWTEYVKERLNKELVKKDVRVTDTLIESLASKVLTKAAGHEGAAQLVFDNAGRFVDMGAGKGYHKGVPTSENIKAKLMGTERRKPIKWYSKTAYGSVNRLMYNFSAKYSEAISLGIKETLENTLKT